MNNFPPEPEAAMKKLNERELEQFIHATLRSLPDRRAPGTLEARVLAEVERRATIAWYHKSWSYWPAAVRAGFLAAGTGLAGLALVAFQRLSQGAAASAVAQEVGHGFGWITRLAGAGGWVLNFTEQMIAHIPALWLYGGLAFIAAMYATFVGLGTAAYRYLYRNP
jgi:hypothetical protein